MKKAKRILALALSLVLALGLLAGCGGNSAPAETAAPQAADTPAAPTEKPEEAVKPVEITVAIWGAEDGLANPDDPILKQIEAKTGVRLVPQNVTWDDAEQKIQLWATNGQLPELIGGFIYPAAGIVDKKWVADENGKFVPSYFASRDNLVDAMQLARDMYTDGVIEKDIALAKLETSKEKYLQGQSAAMVFAWSGPAGLYNNIVRDYEALYGEGSFLEDNRIAALQSFTPLRTATSTTSWIPKRGPKLTSLPR